MLKFEDLKVGDVVELSSVIFDSTYILVLLKEPEKYTYYNFETNKISSCSKLDFEKLQKFQMYEIIPICELFED